MKCNGSAPAPIRHTSMWTPTLSAPRVPGTGAAFTEGMVPANHFEHGPSTWSLWRAAKGWAGQPLQHGALSREPQGPTMGISRAQPGQSRAAQFPGDGLIED